MTPWNPQNPSRFLTVLGIIKIEATKVMNSDIKL